MRLLYLDCFAGISGDMVLGALLDAGLDQNVLLVELQKLNISNYKIESSKVLKNGISAIKCNVQIKEENQHRQYSDIKEIIEKSSLNNKIKEISNKIFYVLAKAESKIHNTSIDKVHFHEVGALDSIIDIIGTAIGISVLKIDAVYCSNIHVGNGFVESQHGTIPVPAPATLELLKNFPVFSKGLPFEMTTPTGAAILNALVEHKGSMPNMSIDAIGYGAGNRDLKIPNALRIVIGNSEMYQQTIETIYSLEVNIDDMNPEIFGYVNDLLFEHGALDVFTQPIYMKKNRPAVLLCVLCDYIHKQKLIELLLKETTTAGVRITIHNRVKLDRRIEKIKTRYGDISIKLIGDHKNGLTISPEYEDCKEIASKYSLPLKDVYNEAKSVAYIKYIKQLDDEKK